MKDKKVLLLLPFKNLCPPANGGLVTCFNMVVTLAKYYRLTTVMYQDVEEFTREAKKLGYSELGELVQLPTSKRNRSGISKLSRISNAVYFRYLTKTNYSVSSAYFDYLEILPGLLKLNKYDFVIFEQLFDSLLFKLIKRNSPSSLFIFQNHNVDSDLAKISWETGEISYREYKATLRLESNLYKRIDGLLAVSDESVQRVNELNKKRIKKITTIQSGVSLPEKLANAGVGDTNCNQVLFVGSLDYSPNTEGIQWFYENCWPLIREVWKEVKLVIVGSGSAKNLPANLLKDDAVKVAGRVPDLFPCYNSSALVIVPLLTGSGIRMKILEAMSMGVPVISTSIGAEGICYTEQDNILIANTPDEFAKSVAFLKDNASVRTEMGIKGRKLVENQYSWGKIGMRINRFLDSL